MVMAVDDGLSSSSSSSVIALWMMVFLLNFSVLGVNMYSMLVLVDLENDYINPYDATRRINSTVLPEGIALGVLLLLLLSAGRFVFFVLLLTLVTFKAYKYRRGKLILDVTEVFGAINTEKRERMAQIVWLAVLFVYAIVETVHEAIAASGQPRLPGMMHAGAPVTVTNT